MQLFSKASSQKPFDFRVDSVKKKDNLNLSPLKVFVFGDRLEILKNASKILKKYIGDIKYFCSPLSKKVLENFSPICAKDLKNGYSDLLDFDLGFSIHSVQIFPKILVEKIRCINLHPGYNPYNKGFYPHIFSIINHFPTGATLHIMTPQIDSGEIIDQIQVIPTSYDTSKSLYKKIQKSELKLLQKNIQNILNQSFKTKKILSGNYNSEKDFKKLCQINLEKKLSFQEAIDYLRALSHSPHHNAYFIDNNQNKIYVSLLLTLNNSKGGGGSN